MAKDFLAVAGTGVPEERLFSTGADLLTARRLSMSPSTIKTCMCLKGWLLCNEKIFSSRFSDAVVQKINSD